MFEAETWVRYVIDHGGPRQKVSTRSGYCSLLCTTVPDIEKSHFLDFLKVFEAETWVRCVVKHCGRHQHGFDTIGLL